MACVQGMKHVDAKYSLEELAARDHSMLKKVSNPLHFASTVFPGFVFSLKQKLENRSNEQSRVLWSFRIYHFSRPASSLLTAR